MRNVRPGHDDVDRQLAREHGAHLHRRGVRAQHLPRALGRRDVEGVLHGARGVVGQEVEGVEVEVLGLHLGTLGDLPAHRDEHVGDLFGDDGDRVARADRPALRGQGDVDGLGDEHGCVALGEERGTARLERLAHPGAGGVDPLAGVGLLGLRQRAEAASGERDRRLVAEVFGLGVARASRSVAAANAFSASAAAAASAPR